MVTLVVALIAAGASLTNIFLTARLGRKSEAIRWARSDRLPFLARFLNTSDEYVALMRKKASLMDRHEEPNSDFGDYRTQEFLDVSAKADAKWQDLEQQRAELEITAPAEVVHAAYNLTAGALNHFRKMLRPGGVWPKQPQFTEVESKRYIELRAAYRDAVRNALAVERLGKMPYVGSGPLLKSGFRQKLGIVFRQRALKLKRNVPGQLKK